VDPATLAYLQKLPLLFSPFPRLSSSSSHSLASRQSSLPPNELWTKCGVCRAEVVGGINGSYWIERGELWMNCQGCGWVTKQIETSEKGKGKEGFESVKKRRRIEAKRREESNSHPTSFLSQPTPVHSPLLKTKRAKVVEAQDRPRPAPAPTNVEASTSKSQTPTPSNPLPSSTSLDTASLPSRPTSVSSNSLHPHSTSASPAPTLLAPPPTSLDSKLAATKKRKRSKQPNGLAELLAKKKKDDGLGGGMGGGGGGLGLQDFLQGL